MVAPRIINVARSFRLTRSDHSISEIGIGPQEADDEVADHWYTKLHLHPDEPVMGSREYALGARKAATAAEAAANAAIDLAAEKSAHAEEAEIAAGMREPSAKGEPEPEITAEAFSAALVSIGFSEPQSDARGKTKVKSVDGA